MHDLLCITFKYSESTRVTYYWSLFGERNHQLFLLHQLCLGMPYCMPIIMSLTTHVQGVFILCSMESRRASAISGTAQKLL